MAQALPRRPVAPVIAEELGATYWESLDQMLARMDIISVNCPHTPATYHLLSARRLKLIRKDAYIVNTARGEVTDEDTLIKLIEGGEIAGAGLDVYEHEPAVNPKLVRLAKAGKVTLLRFAVTHDCGKVINPILVEGQACGAIAFGVGGMLGEQILHDAEGHQLTNDFINYTMPRAADVPAIDVAHHDSPNPVTYMGMKGAGEAGVGGSAAAVVNAVNDALAPFGVEITDLPVSAPRVWAAIRAARAQPKRKVA